MNRYRIRTELAGMAAAAAGLLLGASLIGADTAYARSDDGWRPDPAQRAETYIERIGKDLDLVVP